LQRSRRAALALFVVGALGSWWAWSSSRPQAVPAPVAKAGPPGLWHPVRGEPGDAAAAAAAEAADALAALPYLQGYKPAPARSGVTLHDSPGAFQGVNLVVSGHAPQAFQMDKDGSRLHAWQHPVERLWPDTDPRQEGARYWRRAHAFANGELLAIFDGVGLVKLDSGSRPLWSYRAGCHHDLFVEDDGTIYVLTRTLRVIPEVHPTRPSLEEFVTVLDGAGRERRSVSLYAAFKNSDYAPLLQRVSRGGDIFHTNTLTILDGSLARRSPLFARGRALVSLRNIDTVAIVDLASERVVWALSGLWHVQHEPSLLPNGRLLLFDNAGRAGRSRVLELDPFTQQVAWSYPSAAGHVDIASATSGSTQRLPNGNTLITESTAGRALEVTAEGEVVWEFWNPHRAGERQELIATLLEVVRLPPGFGGSSFLAP
jgi:hypothetical protein